MKIIAAAVVTTLVLTVCAVEETHRAPAGAVSSRRATASTLSKLRSALRQIEHLADEEEVDASLRLAATAGHSNELPPAGVNDDNGLDTNWMPNSVETYKLDSRTGRRGRRRKSGRRRYDTYGVAGRFGRRSN